MSAFAKGFRGGEYFVGKFRAIVPIAIEARFCSGRSSHHIKISGKYFGTPVECPH